MSNQTKWSIDQAHSEITFRVRHLMIANVRGNFKTFDASIYTTDKNFLTMEIDLWIDANSITTGNEERDTHLKSADFLNVAVHKQISFTSSTIDREIDGKHDLWGEFTINGITKNLNLPRHTHATSDGNTGRSTPTICLFRTTLITRSRFRLRASGRRRR